MKFDEEPITGKDLTELQLRKMLEDLEIDLVSWKRSSDYWFENAGRHNQELMAQLTQDNSELVKVNIDLGNRITQIAGLLHRIRAYAENETLHIELKLKHIKEVCENV